MPALQVPLQAGDAALQAWPGCEHMGAGQHIPLPLHTLLSQQPELPSHQAPALPQIRNWHVPLVHGTPSQQSAFAEQAPLTGWQAGGGASTQQTDRLGRRAMVLTSLSK